MKFEKRRVHMNCKKRSNIHQITFDQDKNVPEQMPDMEVTICQKGNVRIDSARVTKDKVYLNGVLNYELLYQSPGNNMGLYPLSGSVSIEESINMDGLEEGDVVYLDADVEDLSITMVNSRKISMKAIVTIHVDAESTREISLVTEAEGEGVCCEYKDMQLSELVARKKDLVRIKEEISLEQGKENIAKILWYTVNLFEPIISVKEGAVDVRGDLSVFILYAGEKDLISFVEAKIPYSGEIEILDSTEGLIPESCVSVNGFGVDIKPDYDGESRIFAVDAVLGVDIKLYAEENIKIVDDVYSVKEDLIPSRMPVEYESLIVKNSSKLRINERVGIGKDDWSKEALQSKMIQICNVSGEVKIDDMQVTNDGIRVEGILMADIIGISENDGMPLTCQKTSIPFSHKIEAKGIKEQDTYRIRTWIDNLSCNMAGGNELEIKAVVCMDGIVFSRNKDEIIEDATAKEYDLEEIGKSPAVHVVVVEAGETLWKIAKNYHSTVENIRKWNNLPEDATVKEGDMLVVVRTLTI